MTPEQIRDRFCALDERVKEMHEKCKAGTDKIPSLIEMFYHCHFLAEAFSEDCGLYLNDKEATPQLQSLASSIYTSIVCSVRHLKECQDALNTHVLDDIIRKLAQSEIEGSQPIN